MAQVGNNDSRFGGEFMIQDRDHMSGIKSTSDKAQRGGARQADQSQASNRQQGGDDQHATGEQGGEHRRKSR